MDSGRFELVRELGRGGFGVVYEGRDPESGVTVAVKVLEGLGVGSVGRTQLLGEVAALKAVDSPHTLRVLDVIDAGATLALVTDLVPGASLRQLLDTHGQLTGRDALVVLRGAAMGLAAVHAAGLVHGDVKPANILVEPDGTSKLIDFGLAGLPGWIAEDSLSAWGSPAYAPPEQVEHNYRDVRSDIYSLTVTLYEVLCGRRPFDGNTADLVREQHVHQPLPDPRLFVADLGEPLTQLLMWGLAKDPAARPPDVATWLTYLEAAAQEKYGAGWAAPASVGAMVGGLIAGGVIASGVLVPGVAGGAAVAGAAGAAAAGSGTAVASSAASTAAGATASAGSASAGASGAGFLSTVAGKVAVGALVVATAGGGIVGGMKLLDSEPAATPPTQTAPAPGKQEYVEKLVLTKWNSKGQTSVWVSDADGGNQVKLAPGSQGDLSPDGKSVAFVTGGGDIATIPVAGGEARTVVDPAVASTLDFPVGSPTWTSDGRSILYMAGQAEMEIWQVDLADAPVKSDEGQRKQQWGSDVFSYSVGPDGRVVLNRTLDRATGESSGFIAELSGAEPRPLQLAGGVGDLAWSPDGTSIAYVQSEFAPDSGSSAFLRVIAPDGSADRAIGTEDFGEGMPRLVWSPDSSELAVVTGNAYPRQTELIDVATGKSTPFLDDAEVTDWGRVPVAPEVEKSEPTPSPAAWSKELSFEPMIVLDGSGKVISGDPAIAARMPADLKTYFESDPRKAMGWECQPGYITYQLERFHPDGFVKGGVNCDDPGIREGAWAIWSRQSGNWKDATGGNGYFDCKTLEGILHWKPPASWKACM